MFRNAAYLLVLSTCLVGCGSDSSDEYPVNTYRMVHWTQTISMHGKDDLLIVLDDSPSMATKQVQLRQLAEKLGDGLDSNFYPGAWHVAVVTTGMHSDSCDPDSSRSGRMQDRLGRLSWDGDQPLIDHVDGPGCRVVSSDNVDCLFDLDSERSSLLVGFDGCGYRRGLAAMRRALSSDMLGSENAGFLREEARLWIILISDGEDCGEVGEVTEGIAGVDGNICSYAAKGIGPDGSAFHPDDPLARPYRLTPVSEYYDFLIGLKDGQEDRVKFAAIVGITDTNDPGSTVIEYQGDLPSSGVVPACALASCSGDQCQALPGTRPVELAQLFGLGRNGFVDSICREDYPESLFPPHSFVTCPERFLLSVPPLDPALIRIEINDQPLPRHSCSGAEDLVGCDPDGGGSCALGECVETWTWHDESESPEAPGGCILFADHVDICKWTLDAPLKIGVTYVAK